MCCPSRCNAGQYGTHVTQANEPTLQLLFPQSSAVTHPFRPRNHPNVLIKGKLIGQGKHEVSSAVIHTCVAGSVNQSLMIVIPPRLHSVHYLRLPCVKQQTAPLSPKLATQAFKVFRGTSLPLRVLPQVDVAQTIT